MFESTLPEFTELVSKMKVVIKDVRIDLKIRDTAKVIFGDSQGFTSKLDKLRKALRRSSSGDYIGGVGGSMEREQDARILAPYHQEAARQILKIDDNAMNPKTIKNNMDDISIDGSGRI